MVITIAVNEGPKYHVGKISIAGYHVTSEEKIRALLKMKEGGVYSPKQLRDDAKAVADAYGSGGYVGLVIFAGRAPARPVPGGLYFKKEEGGRPLFVPVKNFRKTPP